MRRRFLATLWPALERSLHDKTRMTRIEATGAEVSAACPAQFAQVVRPEAFTAGELVRMAGLGLS